jgi:hypothetical protein
VDKLSKRLGSATHKLPDGMRVLVRRNRWNITPKLESVIVSAFGDWQIRWLTSRIYSLRLIAFTFLNRWLIRNPKRNVYGCHLPETANPKEPTREQV